MTATDQSGKKTLDARLAKIYAAGGDKREQYDQWAADYESDVVDDLGYVAHLRATEIFARIVPDKTARVLDMGCGTGLAGVALNKLGYTDIDGADFSPEMVAVAERRGVYRALHQHDVTKPAAFAREYDALISVGLFSYGIPHINALHNVVNCVVRGGECVVTVNGGAWVEHNLADALDAEVAQHQFHVAEIIETDYLLKENINGRVLIIRR